MQGAGSLLLDPMVSMGACTQQGVQDKMEEDEVVEGHLPFFKSTTDEQVTSNGSIYDPMVTSN